MVDACTKLLPAQDCPDQSGLKRRQRCSKKKNHKTNPFLFEKGKRALFLCFFIFFVQQKNKINNKQKKVKDKKQKPSLTRI